MINTDFLKTNFLPKYNCSNCEWYKFEDIETFETSDRDSIPCASECRNAIQPLQDCVLNGFSKHSELPKFKQTLIK